MHCSPLMFIMHFCGYFSWFPCLANFLVLIYLMWTHSSCSHTSFTSSWWQYSFHNHYNLLWYPHNPWNTPVKSCIIICCFLAVAGLCPSLSYHFTVRLQGATTWLMAPFLFPLLFRNNINKHFHLCWDMIFLLVFPTQGFLWLLAYNFCFI